MALGLELCCLGTPLRASRMFISLWSGECHRARGLSGDSGKILSPEPTPRKVPNPDRPASPQPPPHTCGACGSAVAAKTTSTGSSSHYTSTRLDISLPGRWLPSGATWELEELRAASGGPPARCGKALEFLEGAQSIDCVSASPQPHPSRAVPQTNHILSSTPSLSPSGLLLQMSPLLCSPP